VAEIVSIGLIELSSIATGYAVQDAMLKAAEVQILMARSICSGKYLIVIAGDVASVTTAVQAGGAVAGPSLIERRQIAHIHPSVLQAISNAVDIDPKELRSIGVIETFSAASIIAVADECVKSANVTLLRVHLAMALGGKGFVLMAGGSGCRRLQSCRRRRNARRPRRDCGALRGTVSGLHLRTQ
jgi:microcompartment protein CcmL/EutN